MQPVSFSEQMSGWISFAERSYNQAMVAGRRRGTVCVQQLTIEIDDIDRFIADPRHPMHATGFVRCEELGGELAVEDGWLNLFVVHGSPSQRRKQWRILYRLFLRDGQGRALTLSGFKDLQHGPYLDGWGDSSRLLVRILAGHHEHEPEGDQATVATGILHISRLGFARMLASMRGAGGLRGARSVAKFERFFAGQLIRIYGRRSVIANDQDWPSPNELDPRWQGHQPGEWHDLDRPGNLRRRIIEFQAGDGAKGTLHQIRGAHEPSRGPVLLAHGCSVRANMFYGAPTRQTLAGALVDAGYDVWAENWRGSIDLPPSMWTLDEAAVYDHPAAVAKILEETDAEDLKAVVHCQGSTSFMMSAVAGKLPQVTDVVSNAVSLHVNLTPFSQLRLRTMLPAASPLLRGVDPQWTARAPAAVNRAFALWSTVGRRHCDSDVCRAANYFYGVGPDVLWHHSNLDHDTHEWGAREWGFCPVTFFKQMGRCAAEGHLVSTGEVAGLPQSLVDRKPQTDARFTFIAGSQNTCFLPASQERTFAYFASLAPRRHHLHLLPGYTHLDVFLGRNAHRDVFPLIVSALGRKWSRPRPPRHPRPPHHPRPG
jgi:hypothetical protein